MSDELEHSELGPSGASGWRRCPGKPNAERGLPDNARREAAEGTVFHTYAAMALQFGLEPEDFPAGVVHQVDGFEIVYDEDMQHYMHEGLDWIRDNYHPEEGDLIFIEERVDISPWAGPGQFGTGDVCIVKPRARRLIIFDWKYGKGVPVSPVKNDQGFLYGLGFWNTFDLEQYFEGEDETQIEVLIRIEQPRAPGGGGEWMTDMRYLLGEGEQIKKDAIATRDPNAPRIAGPKQCQFCRASGRCKEQAEFLLDTFGQKFDEIPLDEEPTFPDPHTLDLEMRSWMLVNFPAFKKFRDEIHKLTLHDLKCGVDVPLLKAVAGRAGKRFYMPEYEEEVKDGLIRALGADKAFETTPVSPATAEKFMGKTTFKKVLGPYVKQSEAKPILVPLTDKREPIQDFASKFADFDVDEDDNEEEE